MMHLGPQDFFLDTDDMKYVFLFALEDSSAKLRQLAPAGATHASIRPVHHNGDVENMISTEYRPVGTVKTMIGGTKSELIFLKRHVPTPEDLFVETINTYCEGKPFKLSDRANGVIKGIIKKGGSCLCRVGSVPCPCPTHLEELDEMGKCHCGLLVASFS